MILSLVGIVLAIEVPILIAIIPSVSSLREKVSALCVEHNNLDKRVTKLEEEKGVIICQ